MSLTISIEDPLSKAGQALIDKSDAALRTVYTADECFSLDATELAGADTQFFVARKMDEPIGCIALWDCGDYAEIKRLFVDPMARGTGLGQRLVEHLENAATQAGHRVIRLESGDKLIAAVALYRKLGYVDRGPFGAYSAHPASLFMEKYL